MILGGVMIMDEKNSVRRIVERVRRIREEIIAKQIRAPEIQEKLEECMGIIEVETEQLRKGLSHAKRSRDLLHRNNQRFVAFSTRKLRDIHGKLTDICRAFN